jgi:hypothetical protein
MTFTQEDKRDKIRSQLQYEITHQEIPEEKENKSIGGLSKRNRFLQNPSHKRDPNEKRVYSYRW